MTGKERKNGHGKNRRRAHHIPNLTDKESSMVGTCPDCSSCFTPTATCDWQAKETLRRDAVRAYAGRRVNSRTYKHVGRVACRWPCAKNTRQKQKNSHFTLNRNLDLWRRRAKRPEVCPGSNAIVVAHLSSCAVSVGSRSKRDD